MDIEAIGALGGIVILLLIVGGIFLYFLPSFIANRRNAQSGCGIFAVNLLFGWSVLGWIIALIWALADAPKQDTPSVQVYASGSQATPQRTTQATPQRICPNCGRTVGQRATICSHCRYNMARRMKACPYCGEDIRVSAIKCRYCQSDLPVEEESQDDNSTTGAAGRSLWKTPPALGGGDSKACPNPDCGNRFVSGDKCLHCGTSVSGQDDEPSSSEGAATVDAAEQRSGLLETFSEASGSPTSVTPQPCPNPKCPNRSVINKCANCGTSVR